MQETKNADCVEILDECVNLYLEALWHYSGKSEALKLDIATVRSETSSPEDIMLAEERLLKEADKYGLPILYGDLLTYERFRNGQKLRKGSVTIFERLSL